MIDVALVSENKALYNKNCYIGPGENPCFLLFGDYSGCDVGKQPLKDRKILGAINLWRTKKKHQRTGKKLLLHRFLPS